VTSLAFELPASLEATEPPEARGIARDEVRLLVASGADCEIEHARFSDLPALLDRFVTLSHVTCAGLMVIPPFTENPHDARPHFAALRALRDREAEIARPHVELRELSMGMSGDLEAAVAEGATIVRVGTAIFGARQPRG